MKSTIERLPGRLLGICIALVCIPAAAQVRLAEVFADRVVLQQGQPVPVWGWASPGENIVAEFANQTKTATVDANGRWRVDFEPLPASSERRSLVIRGDGSVVQIRDVLVGEVWLFSGQSNMAYLMSSVARPSERDPVSPALAQHEIAQANDDLLREFRVDNRPAQRPRSDVPTLTGWMNWSTENGPKWAAMAYYFGKRLRRDLGVPVGIIMCAWGGSGCSSWISSETLRSRELRTIWPEEVVGWRPNIAPSHLYNGMLHPLAPFAVAGFGWYQGETEATPYHNPFLHRYVLGGMIRDWRRSWQRPELPFYFVQLPNRENEPRWVIVRESQAAVLNLPRTVMVPTIDIGQAWDLHPRNKHDVANRLADFVLAGEYGKGAAPGCAVFEEIARDGSALRVILRDADGGLRTTDNKAPAEFSLAGEDRVFRPAEALIEGRSVVVRSAAVLQPVAVRYAWAPAPQVNLVNAAGIPVPPFRSDDWPVDGQEMLGVDLPVRQKLSDFVTGSDLISGRAEAWLPCGDIDRLGEGARFIFSSGGATGNILVRGFPPRAGLPASPEIYWTAEPEIDPARGLTLEAGAYVTRIGNPTRGFDIEVGIRRNDGGFRRYLVTIFPLRLHTFQNNLAPRNSRATETRVLRSDLAYQPAVYRMAVRADGVAQIYRDGELIGTTAGETLTDDVPARSYLRVGKTVATGEWAVNIQHVSLDASGAFAPASSEGDEAGLDDLTRQSFGPD